MLLTEGALDDPTITPAQKASLLDMEVGHGAIFLLDIPVRYHFEKKLTKRVRTANSRQRSSKN